MISTTTEVQRALIAHGHDLGSTGADGQAGPITRAALAAFQADHGILFDPGPLTLAELSKDAASVPATVSPLDLFANCIVRHLDDADFPRIGSQIGVGEDELHAVLDVETAGSGYDNQGRPKALREPHVFFRNLPASKRAAAVAAGLAYPSWGTKPYPKDSYPDIVRMMAIDETAALKSVSWGLGQILGENFVAAGYDSPQQMVRAMCQKGEAEHLQAMVNFVLANHLDDELRNHQWAAYARGYNGPGYAKNQYDQKLAKRFAFWQSKPDTPWTRQTA